MPAIHITPLHEPTSEIAAAFTRWENDPDLIYLSRPNQNADDLARRAVVTPEELSQRLTSWHLYLIYLEGQLVGEVSYRIDPPYLLKHIPGTAWIGITIGEAHGRGKGLGKQALRYLEQQIAAHGLERIELGVFEFNAPALALYQKLGYQEIGRISDFTYWDGRMWQDIRMEKYLTARGGP